MFINESVKKTEGRETPNLKDIKNKVKIGVDDYLEYPNVKSGLSSCANREFLKQDGEKPV